jgi:hypothetical protein
VADDAAAASASPKQAATPPQTPTSTAVASLLSLKRARVDNGSADQADRSMQSVEAEHFSSKVSEQQQQQQQNDNDDDNDDTDATHDDSGSPVITYVSNLDAFMPKSERVARVVDQKLGPEEAEAHLSQYVRALDAKLTAMRHSPFRLSTCQRPDDRFLHEIDLPVLYKLPTFLKYQGREYPPALYVSDMLFRDPTHRVYLDIKRLRARVIVRIEKSGQRKRQRDAIMRSPAQPQAKAEPKAVAESVPVPASVPVPVPKPQPQQTPNEAVQPDAAAAAASLPMPATVATESKSAAPDEQQAGEVVEAGELHVPEMPTAAALAEAVASPSPVYIPTPSSGQLSCALTVDRCTFSSSSDYMAESGFSPVA